MGHQKTLSAKWLLPLLFFFLLINLSKANALILNVGGEANNSSTANKAWVEPELLAKTALELDGITSITSQPHPYNSQPKIITNENDKAFAVWTQYNSIGDTSTTYSTNRIDVKYSLWSAYFDGENWSSPMRIKGITPSEKTTVPEIVFDDNGDVLATWTEFTRINHYRFASQIVLASRFDSRNLDWNYPTQLTYEDVAIRSLKIASRNNGEIHSVWEQREINSDNSFRSLSLWSSVFNGSSWNNPTKIYESSTIKDYRTKTDPIFSNYNNDIMSVYLGQNDDFSMGVFANHFNGSNWSTPQRLSSDVMFVSGSKAGFDQNGNAIAVWRNIGTEQNNYALDILASHFNRSSRSWSTPVPISGVGGGYPEVAVNKNGNALVVWHEGSFKWEGNTLRSNKGTLWASYFNGSNWSIRIPIDSGISSQRRDVFNILNVEFNNNQVHVVWSKTVDGNSRVWTNRFDGKNWASARSMELETNSVVNTPLTRVSTVGSLNVAIGGDGSEHALGSKIVRTWTREEPFSNYPWKETKTKTIWTSQLKASPPIMIQQAVVYMPYGGFVVITGANFMEYNEVTNKLVDQDGNSPLAIYVWRGDMVVAIFRDVPESVTMTNPNGTKVISLHKYY